ncbi:MAG TPA: response regulator [Thermoanaerobaculia bacterium]|nr:response regulator [Thermoanaerobaculia bacterium]
MNDAPRALIVEDDDPIRMMLRKIVERLDFVVDDASDGAEAIEQIESHDYAVILLDLMMPRVDGYSVLTHLQKEHPQVLPRTIIASAVPEGEIAKRFSGPVFGIHSKPFEIERLVDALRTCAQGAAQSRSDSSDAPR